MVAENGRPVYQKAFGLANREKNVANRLNTKLLIGSTNKSFTRVVILQLVAEGKIKFTQKMTAYLDGFHQNGASEITIKQLLDHSSDLGDYETMDYVNLPYEKKNLHTIVELGRQKRLLFSPGQEHEYSNLGYCLLGAIIEKATGKSYIQNVEDRIIEPLGMTGTYIRDIKNRPDRAIGYMRTFNGVENTENIISEPRPDGGFWCTASDILNFYQEFYYGNKIIPSVVRKSDEYFSHISGAYNDPKAVVDQAGGTNGHNSSLIQLLKENISIIVLANMDEPVAETLSQGIYQLIRGKSPVAPSLPAVVNTYLVYQDKGLLYLKTHFDEVTGNFNSGDPKDLILNNLGYQLLQSDRLNDALEIFKLNTELFPDIANCWDSYGEALLKKGDKSAALSAYKKALSIRPDLPSAIDAVKKLESESP